MGRLWRYGKLWCGTGVEVNFRVEGRVEEGSRMQVDAGHTTKCTHVRSHSRIHTCSHKLCTRQLDSQDGVSRILLACPRECW